MEAGPETKGAEVTRRRAVLVMGMPLSGTTAVARVLACLGVDFGKRPEEVVRLDEALLAAARSGWDDIGALAEVSWREGPAAALVATLRALVGVEFGDARLVGVEDPRLSRLFPVWNELLGESGDDVLPVLVGGAPATVAASLQRVHALSLDRGHAIWLRYLLEAERATRGRRRLFVSHEELLRDWRRCVERIGSGLDVSWPRSPELAAADVEAILDLAPPRAPGLAGVAGVPVGDAGPDPSPLLPPLARWTTRGWELFEAAVKQGEADGAGFDALHAEFEAAITRAQPFVREWRVQRKALRHVEAELEAVRREAKIPSGRLPVDGLEGAPVPRDLYRLAREVKVLEGELASRSEELEQKRLLLAAFRITLRRRRRLVRMLSRIPLLRWWRWRRAQARRGRWRRAK